MSTAILKRRSIRLKKHDYSEPGYYFVTACAQKKVYLFGEIVNGVMGLNEFGKIVHRTWCDLPNHYCNIGLDSYVIMPNHFHGIVMIDSTSNVGAGLPRPGHRPGPVVVAQGAETAPLRPKLGQIIAYFKYQTTKLINEHRKTPGVRLWQRNYYERVIRHEQELTNIRQYIQNNPKDWHLDPENGHA